MENPLADYKEKTGISVTDLAEKLGTSKGHVSDLVNGRVRIGVKIARAFGLLTGKPWHKYLPEDSD